MPGALVYQAPGPPPPTPPLPLAPPSPPPHPDVELRPLEVSERQALLEGQDALPRRRSAGSGDKNQGEGRRMPGRWSWGSEQRQKRQREGETETLREARERNWSPAPTPSPAPAGAPKGPAPPALLALPPPLALGPPLSPVPLPVCPKQVPKAGGDKGTPAPARAHFGLPGQRGPGSRSDGAASLPALRRGRGRLGGNVHVPSAPGARSGRRASGQSHRERTPAHFAGRSTEATGRAASSGRPGWRAGAPTPDRRAGLHREREAHSVY